MTRTRSASRSASGASATVTAAPDTPPSVPSRHYAIVGAGMAGIACARTLVQAGHRVTVFEQADRAGGRTATVDSPFGGFDAGAQYFTVRDARFEQALATVPDLCKRWSATSVRVLDAEGKVEAAGLPTRDPHWVASPGMDALVRAWAHPLQNSGQLLILTDVTHVERDPLDAERWQVRIQGPGGIRQVHAGFDGVLFALPAPPLRSLLDRAGIDTPWRAALDPVTIAPCWTLMLAFPQAVRPGLTTLGPQWNAARSSHHRIAWVARESSKPGRSQIERWTVQASPTWSQEHLQDDPARVLAKLQKAFGEITGIRAEPAHAEVRCWPHAQTLHPLGQSHLWDDAQGLGCCGDWCLGHRLEDAFVSGLELALSVA